MVPLISVAAKKCCAAKLSQYQKMMLTYEQVVLPACGSSVVKEVKWSKVFTLFSGF